MTLLKTYFLTRFANKPITSKEVKESIYPDMLDMKSDVDNLNSASGLNVTIAHQDSGATFTATATGGTPPYTYLWSNVCRGNIGGVAADFPASVTSQVLTITVSVGNPGMVRCTVTDAVGAKADAYFLQMSPDA